MRRTGQRLRGARGVVLVMVVGIAALVATTGTAQASVPSERRSWTGSFEDPFVGVNPCTGAEHEVQHLVELRIQEFEVDGRLHATLHGTLSFATSDGFTGTGHLANLSNGGLDGEQMIFTTGSSITLSNGEGLRYRGHVAVHLTISGGEVRTFQVHVVDPPCASAGGLTGEPPGRARVTSEGPAASMLGMKRPAVLRWLKGLEEAGLIEWSGKSKKDPRASWKIRT
jgi:hypothetical protein